jgi:UDP-N-acetylglucosamine--N-acetylmuramyl-(pentapeptide) pyrophosphoryl-undecaprenol N-acetylglucosamine transferase
VHLPKRSRVRTTGTPVRREFLRQRGAAQARLAETEMAGSTARQPRLLILGGSGGARALNQHVPPAIYKAHAALAGWEIVHQTGERDETTTAALYAKLGIRAQVSPFFDDLAALVAGSDLAISRAGGSTLAELAVCAVPAILLPYPHATGDHQRKNADLVVAAGAARLVDERELNGRLDHALAAQIIALADNAPLRKRMADNLARVARPQAARQVAQYVVDVLAGRQAAA